MKLSSDMRRVVNEQRLGFVATVRPDGGPNVSPKGTTVVLDDHHLLFADVASPNTVANLRSEPRVEINIVDPIVRKGYRFRGTATVHVGDEMYRRGVALLHQLGSSLTAEHIRSIVVVEVLSADQLISPAYDLGASEHDVAARWMATFTELNQGRPEPPDPAR